MPVISVIIPTYNRAHCICDAVDSVLAQTYANYEIIVIDDGSTDDTPSVLAAYGDRIHVIRQANAGVSAARNTGIAAATGDWIAFLDSDDEWVPTKLERQMKCLEEYPEAVGSVCDAEIISGNQRVSLFTLRNYFPDEGKCQLVGRPLISLLKVQFFTPSWVFSRRAIQLGGLFNESLSLYEDLDFSARVALLGPWCVVPEILLRVMHKSSDNLSAQHIADPTRTPRNAVQIYEGLLTHPNLDRHERMDLLTRLANEYFVLGKEMMRQGVNSAAGDYLHQSLKCRLTAKSLAKVVLLYLFRPSLYEILSAQGRRKSFRRSEIERGTVG